ncbi:response regulator [Leptothermofonsia sichuanensis E412]|jgi:twitching motility two-component system response regulator PilH|uniref:response regulator n=1 Tax=Leptothermofonsia sichuanensis TaxID=2917832 RepID=UPI001CA76199|nr:response regulator [Leptothermofonsia sichuanensis]QZZ23007.1 response regulator [Leptothermofonsia sichuanensis E412]
MTTVLIVDDSHTVREMLSDQLKRSGFTVVEAADGEEAIEKIKVSSPDLVVTDIVMPRKNGYELCRWIKNDPATRHIPVVMCTSKSEEFDVYWGMKQGADAYITKPYHPPDMLEAVKKLLSQAKG